MEDKMRGGAFASVRTYLVMTAVLATAATLILTIFFTHDNLPWVAFLTGILIASVLAEAARATRSEWVLMRRTAQLSTTREKLDVEIRLRKISDQKLVDAHSRLQLIDESLSTMVVLVDHEGHCRYHNRAFRQWLHLKAELIDGRLLRDILGARAYAEIATAVQQSLNGHSMHYEHLQSFSDNGTYRLLIEHIPQFDAHGRVSGFYLLAEDITGHGDLLLPEHTRRLSNDGNFSQTDEVAKRSKQDNGKAFISAVQRGDFRLYCQLISPLPLDADRATHYAILIRLLEEENSVMPPGAFFPVAEKNGLMPYLDHWVVQHVLEWAAHQQNLGRDQESLFFIDVATATICDPDFPAFLRNALAEQGMSGTILCFEVADTDLQLHCTGEFIRAVRQCGCRIALTGFGKDESCFDHIRGFQVDFFKIDGGLILNDPVDLARVVSINRIAKIIGVQTIAELVESEQIVEKLVEIGIDFSQGSSISQPHPLIP
jgi:PAS domain S-box-containing protein